ncbi:hypothetical protein [Pseudogemmobacter sonorensis]|uniref:hypothetical protein n=1 Tax=Pseudogemmobacter sonorensis TaxID=2989681 RepID=UPI0036B9C72A
MQIRFSRIFIPLLAMGLLAACGGELPQAPGERLSPRTHEAVLSYSFLSCSTEIGAAEQKRIRAFLDTLGLTSQDTLVVSVPKNRLPERDGGRRKTLGQIFAAYPARVRFVQDDDLRELPRSEAQGIIRVVRVTGVEVTCRGGSAEAGCATAGNLAAMIAHPADTFMPDKGDRYLPPVTAPQAGLAP